ncbi:hypothetical protein ACWF82_10145 [Nocardia sp. NPDC055053]
MTNSDDWQKELSATMLGSLLRREHETNDIDHMVTTAAHLVRLMHEEEAGQLSGEVLSEQTPLSFFAAATTAMKDLVRNHDLSPDDPSSTSWLRPDFHKWFEAELLNYLEPEEIHG